MSRVLLNRSIIIACDLSSVNELERIVECTCSIEGVGGYKVGFSLGLKYGLSAVIGVIRRHTDKAVLYDHQKGGTDVPHTGELFADVMAEAGVDYAILFPFASPSTERAWIAALNERRVIPIVGAVMTIPDFLKENGGFLDYNAVSRIIEIACSVGVSNFVLPGNKPEIASAMRKSIEARVRTPSYFLPGVGSQGGEISTLRDVLGERWHAIVGRSIYESSDPHKAASLLTRELP